MKPSVALIIPALDEENSIGGTLGALQSHGLGQILVVDNGSRDRTAEVAREYGAQTIRQPRRGYGRACLAGIAALAPDIRVVAFMDADGSDDPNDLERLLAPIERDEADLVLGSRMLGPREAGSLEPQQRLGNGLAVCLLRLFFGGRETDLGPFRAIRREALESLHMCDPDFGWTIEMQIKARRRGLRVSEIPVSYRKRRAGKSKVSGSFRGSILAGTKIIWTIFRYLVSE